MIQAMISAFVLTSGAGMSDSGPTRTLISAANRRVRRSSSRWLSVRGVDGDTALGAAVRQVRERALPGHPHRERLDLVDVGRRMEPEAALGGAASDVVLDAIALEHADAAVVHLHGEAHDQLAPNLTQHRAQPRREIEDLGGVVELALGVQPGRVHHRRRGNRAHAHEPSRLTARLDAARRTPPPPLYCRECPTESAEVDARRPRARRSPTAAPCSSTCARSRSTTRCTFPARC